MDIDIILGGERAVPPTMVVVPTTVVMPEAIAIMVDNPHITPTDRLLLLVLAPHVGLLASPVKFGIKLYTLHWTAIII